MMPRYERLNEFVGHIGGSGKDTSYALHAVGNTILCRCQQLLIGARFKRSVATFGARKDAAECINYGSSQKKRNIDIESSC